MIYKSNLNGWYTSDDRSNDLHGFALLQDRFRRLKSYFFNRCLLNLDDYVHYDANQNQINANKKKSIQMRTIDFKKYLVQFKCWKGTRFQLAW